MVKSYILLIPFPCYYYTKSCTNHVNSIRIMLFNAHNKKCMFHNIYCTLCNMIIIHDQMDLYKLQHLLIFLIYNEQHSLQHVDICFVFQIVFII